MKWILALFVAATLSGCIDGSVSQGPNGQQASAGDAHRVTFAGQGQYNGDIEGKVIECDGNGTVSASAQGQGDLEIIVTDGADEEVYRFSVSGQSQKADQQDLSGTAGKWNVKVTTGYDEPVVPVMEPQPRSFQGQYAGHVTC